MSVAPRAIENGHISIIYFQNTFLKKTYTNQKINNVFRIMSCNELTCFKCPQFKLFNSKTINFFFLAMCMLTKTYYKNNTSAYGKRKL